MSMPPLQLLVSHVSIDVPEGYERHIIYVDVQWRSRSFRTTAKAKKFDPLNPKSTSVEFSTDQALMNAEPPLTSDDVLYLRGRHCDIFGDKDFQKFAVPIMSLPLYREESLTVRVGVFSMRLKPMNFGMDRPPGEAPREVGDVFEIDLEKQPDIKLEQEILQHLAATTAGGAEGGASIGGKKSKKGKKKFKKKQQDADAPPAPEVVPPPAPEPAQEAPPPVEDVEDDEDYLEEPVGVVATFDTDAKPEPLLVNNDQIKAPLATVGTTRSLGSPAGAAAPSPPEVVASGGVASSVPPGDQSRAMPPFGAQPPAPQQQMPPPMPLQQQQQPPFAAAAVAPPMTNNVGGSPLEIHKADSNLGVLTWTGTPPPGPPPQARPPKGKDLVTNNSGGGGGVKSLFGSVKSVLKSGAKDIRNSVEITLMRQHFPELADATVAGDFEIMFTPQMLNGHGTPIEGSLFVTSRCLAFHGPLMKHIVSFSHIVHIRRVRVFSDSALQIFVFDPTKPPTSPEHHLVMQLQGFDGVLSKVGQLLGVRDEQKMAQAHRLMIEIWRSCEYQLPQTHMPQQY